MVDKEEVSTEKAMMTEDNTEEMDATEDTTEMNKERSALANVAASSPDQCEKLCSEVEIGFLATCFEIQHIFLMILVMADTSS